MGSAAEKTKLFLREENSGFVHVIFYQCAAVHVLYGTTVVSRRKQPSRHISFEFLFIKTCPPDKLHNGFYFVVQFRVGIRYLSVRGASFDKIEFKRNVAGRLLRPLLRYNYLFPPAPAIIWRGKEKPCELARPRNRARPWPLRAEKSSRRRKVGR